MIDRQKMVYYVHDVKLIRMHRQKNIFIGQQVRFILCRSL